MSCVFVPETCALDAESCEPTPTRSSASTEEAATLLGTLALITPFFLWGTSMVAMKPVLEHTGPFFVASVRLIPAGLAVVLYALSKGRCVYTCTLSVTAH